MRHARSMHPQLLGGTICDAAQQTVWFLCIYKFHSRPSSQLVLLRKPAIAAGYRVRPPIIFKSRLASQYEFERVQTIRKSSIRCFFTIDQCATFLFLKTMPLTQL
jgi:hypothetical protein